MLLAGALAGTLCACAHVDSNTPKPQPDRRLAIPHAIEQVKQKYAPVKRLGIYEVGVQHQGLELVLTGEVSCAEARIDTVRAVEATGAKVTDRIKVLPDERLGDQVWGISCLSVASGRELPEHKAEMGTQILMGNVVRVWKPSTNAVFRWYLTQAADGYLSWLQKGTFVRCTQRRAAGVRRGGMRPGP